MMCSPFRGMVLPTLWEKNGPLPEKILLRFLKEGYLYAVAPNEFMITGDQYSARISFITSFTAYRNVPLFACDNTLGVAGHFWNSS